MVAKVFVMGAHFSDGMQFVLQGGPGRVRGPRGKYYAGYFCLQVAIDGDLEIAYDDNVFRFQQPVAWISRPGPFIKYAMPAGGQPWIHRFVGFSGPTADLWFAQGLVPMHPVVIEEPASICAKMDALLAIDVLPERAWELARKRNVLESLLLDLVQPSRTTPQDWLAEAQDLLLRGDWELAAIAKHLGMGVSTLRRKFKAATGRSPQHWRLEERMRQAQELLHDETLLVSDIAGQLHYPSIFQFSKQFKKFVGLTPTEWRQAIQT